MARATKVTTAVHRLIRGLGELGPEQAVLAAQARHLANQIESGAIPPYSVAAAHRELRACIGQLEALPGPGAGLTEEEVRELLA